MTARGRGCARGVAALVSLCALAACGASGNSDDAGGTPTLTWYVGPDRVDTAAIATTCTNEADGAYRIEVEQLPTDVTSRHSTLVRRLAARDDTIDLLSVDSELAPELAAAGYLAPVPDALAATLSEGILPSALAAATHDDQLVVAPWFFDPQLLWFRGNVAERAGLDTTGPISWDDLVAGAERLDVTIQVEDRDGSGLAAWVAALVDGAGGDLLSGAGRTPEVGLDSEAGRAAASIVELYRQADVGPGPSDEALSAFAGPEGGFLLASSSVISDPALAPIAADLGWTAYPAVADASIAPMSGVALAVPSDAPRTAMSYDAIECLTSPAVVQTLMTTSGHSAARVSTYDDESVKEAYPLADVTSKAIETGQAVPVTPYWRVVRDAIDRTWLPIDDVSQDVTPGAAQQAVRDAVRGRLG